MIVGVLSMKRFIGYITILLLIVCSSCKKDTIDNCVKGPVNPNCVCPLVTIYVCGCNNQTYENSCEAECDGIT